VGSLSAVVIFHFGYDSPGCHLARRAPTVVAGDRSVRVVYRGHGTGAVVDPPVYGSRSANWLARDRGGIVGSHESCRPASSSPWSDLSDAGRGQRDADRVCARDYRLGLVAEPATPEFMVARNSGQSLDHHGTCTASTFPLNVQSDGDIGRQLLDWVGHVVRGCQRPDYRLAHLAGAAEKIRVNAVDSYASLKEVSFHGKLGAAK